MPSFLSWVDFSSEDRERMRRTIALFQEKETRDELGVGTIRDAFANSMFPGTSTIQTRLRYFLFVPWVYRALAAGRTNAANVSARARKRELALIDALTAAGETDGVIGSRSKASLQRLPSSIYWAGLSAWGIYTLGSSREQYHRDFDVLRRATHREADPDDAGLRVEVAQVWHPKLPGPPEGWPDEVSFALKLEEAEFLRGRIAESAPGSLLDWLARNGQPGDVHHAWEYLELGRLPLELRKEIDLARRFSSLVHGAALLYNVMLAELKHDTDREAEHRESLREWATGSESSDLPRFDFDELSAYLLHKRAVIPERTLRFVRDWSTRVREAKPQNIADDADARGLIAEREKRLKKARSRLANRRALDQWGGSAGAGRINYRWHIVQRQLNDLYAALD